MIPYFAKIIAFLLFKSYKKSVIVTVKPCFLVDFDDFEQNKTLFEDCPGKIKAKLPHFPAFDHYFETKKAAAQGRVAQTSKTRFLHYGRNDMVMWSE